ncbi:hypothetical protein BDR06DRAFT_894125 [Suillus hirtellus]|nr:hypothetical protein BDR06DRAFT_894125 [Suillus hirtellus]
MSQVVGDVLQPLESSLAVTTSESARQKQKIAALKEKLQVLESGHAVKLRETNYYMSKGRAIRRIVTLFDTVEDMISKNDRRCDLDKDKDDNVTLDQEHLQIGYIALNHALPWFHPKASDMEYEDYMLMLKKLRQGADAAWGDDTSKLKSLVADWVNREFNPNPPVDPEDKHHHGFINDASGRLLCLTELDWNNPIVRAGIRDCADGYIVTEMSWPAFLYEKYSADQNNLEEGLFKGTLLLQAFNAIFMSPSSAKEVAGEGDGADNFNSGKKVKTHVAQIINMRKLQFVLSSVTSWCSVDGNFDYIPFWQNIVDFFERPPGRAAQ